MIKKRNRGSAVVEMTLLVPFVFGSIYFYIMSMLYITEHGRRVNELSEMLYNNVAEAKDGLVSYDGDFEKYSISLDLRMDNTDSVKSLRRWQFVADTIH